MLELMNWGLWDLDIRGIKEWGIVNTFIPIICPYILNEIL